MRDPELKRHEVVIGVIVNSKKLTACGDPDMLKIFSDHGFGKASVPW
jgi:hypothetical protein